MPRSSNNVDSAGVNDPDENTSGSEYRAHKKPNFIDSNAEEIEHYMKDKYDDPDRYVH